MKYKEFEHELNRLGFYVERDYKQILFVYTPQRKLLLVIDDELQHDLHFTERHEDDLNLTDREKITMLAIAYAWTPIEKRKGEPKYNVVACRIKRGNPENILEDVKYYYRGYNGWLSVASDIANDDRDQQWTLKQIEQYGLEKCERIEVD